jgi:hypothetical protein
MAHFTWTNAAGGDWSNAANWSPSIFAPPGLNDTANFNDLANAYTVTVTGTVGISVLSPSISIDAVSASNDVAFSISGRLTGNFIYNTNMGGPATSLTIEAGGSLIVPELLYSIDIFETVTVSGTGAGGYLELGNLTVGGFVSGTNSLMILDFANAGPATLNTGVIQIDNIDLSSPVIAPQTITSVAWGDEIVIKGANFTGDTVTFNPLNNDLMVMNGGTAVFTMDNVSLQSGASNNFTIVNADTILALCYVLGTMILTPAGEQPIEKLELGQPVITLIDGEAVPRPVKWVGHRRIDLTRHPHADAIAPIRVERDAFADNVPHRDLLLSPDHAVFTNGVLICVRQLVNGSTIRRERGWTSVDYYHVELDRHAILLAEGLTAESYLNTGNSAFFENSGTPMVLHPNLPNDTKHPTRETDSCAPFVSDGARARPVWHGLAERADVIGRAAPVRVTTMDASPRLQCSDGRTIEPIHRDGDRVIFALPGVASEVRLISRAQAPTEARPWLGDPRRLGVCVKRIVLRGADQARDVPMDHPDFAHGWWTVEHDGPIMSRWTDGEAVLLLPPMRGPAMLEIHLAGAMIYLEDAEPVGGTEWRAA